MKGTHLEGEKEEEGLDGVEASVNKVAEEKVVGLRDITADLEELLQVVELTVDVTADSDRGLHSLHVTLLREDFPGLGTQSLHLALLDKLALAELRDLTVKVAVI
jgi:hypothetical protein